MAAASKPIKRSGHAGSLRIIGGVWRSRRLRFPDNPELRPTPDRVRETLFNWLQPYLAGAQCLDLFAGSGALGLEALSRGAAHAVLVEKAPPAVAALRANIEQLKAQQAEPVLMDCLVYLQGPAKGFDVVFLDPPYQAGLLGACCVQLEAGGWVKPNGLVYLEAAAECAPPVPDSWVLLHSKKAGQVGYHLARKAK